MGPDTTPAIVPQSPKESPKKSPVKEAKNETDTTPAMVPQTPKKSPKKSPVKEAKNETDEKLAPVNTVKKNVKKPAASPAGKKKKDPNAPKMPTTAFFHFQAEQRLKIKTENPNFSVCEISKELGRMWKEMKPEVKQKFTDKYAESKKKYDLDMAAYKEGNYNPVQNNKNKSLALNEKSVEPDTSLN